MNAVEKIEKKLSDDKDKLKNLMAELSLLNPDDKEDKAQIAELGLQSRELRQAIEAAPTAILSAQQKCKDTKIDEALGELQKSLEKERGQVSSFQAIATNLTGIGKQLESTLTNAIVAVANVRASRSTGNDASAFLKREGII